jgi:hypothetical protein
MVRLTPAHKRLALLMLVVGCALAAERTLSPGDDDEVAGLAPALPRDAGRAPALAAATTRAAALDLDRLDARQRALDAAAPRATPFGRVSWAPPPPPPPPPAPPPRPVAPPFAYTYLGALLDGGVRTAFFGKDDRVLALKAGDTVDGAYRVDDMNDKQMLLTYLPLDQKLSVPLGGVR